ncbi:Zinc finger Y-chromosomal protein 2-like, partial [Homarus americanus]
QNGRDEGGSGASGGARRYCGPVGVSAVRNVEGSTGGLSCPYCGKGRDERGNAACRGARRYEGSADGRGHGNVDGPHGTHGSAGSAVATSGGLTCPCCGKVLRYHSDYERHIRKHTGERPFACLQCTYATTRRSHLKTHVKKWHSDLDTTSDIDSVSTSAM